jgi:predicted DNA-binding ribbon-helix-helix protein
MRYLGIRIEESLYRRLKVVAAKKDLSVTEIVRGLIESWVTKQEASDDDVRRRSSQ